MSQPYTRIELKVPDSSGLVQQIDLAAQLANVSRSEWIRKACQEKLTSQDDTPQDIKQLSEHECVNCNREVKPSIYTTIKELETP